MELESKICFHFFQVFESNRLYYVSYAAQSIRCSTDLDGIELQYQVTQGNMALIFYRTYAGAMDGYFVANVTYFTGKILFSLLCLMAIIHPGSVSFKNRVFKMSKDHKHSLVKYALN